MVMRAHAAGSSVRSKGPSQEFGVSHVGDDDSLMGVQFECKDVKKHNQLQKVCQRCKGDVQVSTKMQDGWVSSQNRSNTSVIFFLQKKNKQHVVMFTIH